MKKIKEEIWASARYIRPDGAVLDFTGLYEVSDLGRVRSLNYRNTGKIKVMSPVALKGRNGSIYYIVGLHKDSKVYQLTIHRLILSSFKEGEYFSGAIVDHTDARTETSCDNRLSNLRWVTYQQNNSTEHFKELQSKAQTNHPAKSKRVKVTDLTACASAIYPSTMEAERALDLPCRTICSCIRNRKGFYKKLNLRFAYV